MLFLPTYLTVLVKGRGKREDGTVSHRAREDARGCTRVFDERFLCLACVPEEMKMTATGWKGSKTKTRCFLSGTGEQFSESRIARRGTVARPASDVWAQRLQGTTQASWSSSLARRGLEVKAVGKPCVGDSSSSLPLCGSCGGRMGL